MSAWLLADPIDVLAGNTKSLRGDTGATTGGEVGPEYGALARAQGAGVAFGPGGHGLRISHIAVFRIRAHTTACQVKPDGDRAVLGVFRQAPVTLLRERPSGLDKLSNESPHAPRIRARSTMVKISP